MTQDANMETVLVQCSSSAGMFDTEVAVAIDTVDGLVSLFADRRLVDDSGAGTSLRAYAALGDEVPSGQVSLLLPSEAFETGTRWIRVASGKVRTLG